MKLNNKDNNKKLNLVLKVKSNNHFAHFKMKIYNLQLPMKILEIHFIFVLIMLYQVILNK